MSDHFVVKGYKVLEEIEEMTLRKMFRVLDIRSGNEVFLTHIDVRPGRALELLKKRAEQSKKLKIKNLVGALDFGKTKQGFYYTQTLSATLPLMRVLDEVSDSDRRSYLLARYFIKVLEVIDYIHRAKSTHRDIQTSFLRITENEQVFIEGFINARPKMEARSIVNMVEFPYMAPEILLGRPADKKTDIFSLGVVFFELLTGRLPYSSNFSKIEEMKQGKTPSLGSFSKIIPNEFEKMFLRSLGNRNTRYNNCREWLNDMEQFYKKRPLSLKIKDLSQSVKTIFSTSI